MRQINIARGAMDPGYWLCISSNLYSICISFVTILPPYGANNICCKFSQQVARLALVANLATRLHHLHWLSPLALILNLAPFGLVINLTTRWVTDIGHQVVTFASPKSLEFPYWHHQLVSSSVISIKSRQHRGGQLSHWTPGPPEPDKKKKMCMCFGKVKCFFLVLKGKREWSICRMCFL